AAQGFVVKTAAELELYCFTESFEGARAKRYHNLTPVASYLEDYHILQTTKEEPLIRAIRNGMEGADVPVETSKGEWGRGQEEINLRYAEALEMADRAALYKHSAKEIAHLMGSAVTFMAKYDMGAAGSSFHLHSSLWDKTGRRALFAATGSGAPPRGGSPLFRHGPPRPREPAQGAQALRGQRVRGRDAPPGAQDAARGDHRARALEDRARGLRRARRRALPAHRAARAASLRPGGHRLGADAQLRADLTTAMTTRAPAGTRQGSRDHAARVRCPGAAGLHLAARGPSPVGGNGLPTLWSRPFRYAAAGTRRRAGSYVVPVLSMAISTTSNRSITPRIARACPCPRWRSAR